MMVCMGPSKFFCVHAPTEAISPCSRWPTSSSRIPMACLRPCHSVSERSRYFSVTIRSEVLRRTRPDGSDIALLQVAHQFIENTDGLLAALPFGLRAQQVFLGHHLQIGRAHV